MPALNFTKFVDKVESGKKCCSIRAGTRFKKGDTLYAYTGMRAKKCRLLFVAPVIKVVEFSIVHVVDESDGEINGSNVFLNGSLLSPTQLRALVLRDGFAGIDEFMEYFGQRIPPFTGQLIEWDYFQRIIP